VNPFDTRIKGSPVMGNSKSGEHLKLLKPASYCIQGVGLGGIV
jgi:hypothetical protein